MFLLKYAKYDSDKFHVSSKLDEYCIIKSISGDSKFSTTIWSKGRKIFMNIAQLVGLKFDMDSEEIEVFRNSATYLCISPQDNTRNIAITNERITISLSCSKEDDEFSVVMRDTNANSSGLFVFQIDEIEIQQSGRVRDIEI